jgi:hypothetical protein
MKMTYLFIVLIVIASLVFYIVRSTKMTKTSDKSEKPAASTSNDAQENAYEGLRSLALNMSADTLGITLPSDKIVVYGVVMDWNMGKAIATLTAFQTGDASLYLSSGGGILGGGPRPSVNSVARQLVAAASEYIDKARKTETTPLPGSNEIRFYLLTNKGTYEVREEMKNFENKTSPWLGLFNEANNVLTALRLTMKQQ